MSLPSSYLFSPLGNNLERDNLKNIGSKLEELTVQLQDMYEQIAQAVNGDIRADFRTDARQWLPDLKGTSTSGTFTYTNQYGLVLRQGLMVDVWFDVSWSSSGEAAGNLYLELPYKVAVSNGMPFVGIVQSSSLTYTSGTYIVMNAIENTYRGELWNSGNGVATGNQGVVASGGIKGHIRYLGQAVER